MPIQQFDVRRFAVSPFPVHGRSSAEIDGAVVRIVGEGPYNLELVQANCHMLGAVGMSLPADRRYVELIEFRTSLLMPREAWQHLAAFMAGGVTRGFVALGTVLVCAPEVEGEALFLNDLQRLWASSRPVLRARSRAEGEVLLAGLIEQHGLAPTSAIQPRSA